MCRCGVKTVLAVWREAGKTRLFLYRADVPTIAKRNSKNIRNCDIIDNIDEY